MPRDRPPRGAGRPVWGARAGRGRCSTHRQALASRSARLGRWAARRPTVRGGSGPGAPARASEHASSWHQPSTSAQRGHVDLARARPVELAEEDALPAAEREPAVLERDEHLRAHERGADVRRRVRPVRILDVLPAPAVLDDLLERGLEVAGDGGVGVLVDRHARSRVRDVDQRGRGAVRLAERVLDRLRDVDQLRPALRLETDLAHPWLSYETVPTALPSQRELDDYREQADRFIAELDEEAYLHYAGHKETYEIARIYERYAELHRLERAQALGLAVNGSGGIRELWRFACEGYLGNLTREHAERVATLEAELQVPFDGETIPFRMLRPTIANEPDRGRRERLERARNELVEEHMNPVYLDAARIEHDAVHDLEAPGYVELYRRFGFNLDGLALQCRAFLDSTERLYEQAADRLFRARERGGRP